MGFGEFNARIISRGFYYHVLVLCKKVRHTLIYGNEMKEVTNNWTQEHNRSICGDNLAKILSNFKQKSAC